MAVAVVLKFDGATMDQYDQVLAKMESAPGGPVPPGALFHWVTQTDGGIMVTDVWETREAFDQFAAEQIGPFSAEAGITAPPEMTYHEVHNYLTTR